MGPGDVMGMATFCGAVILLVWIISNNIRRRKIAELQTGMHTKLLERFGTSSELLEFLKSDAGQKFLESATPERDRPGHPARRILGSIRAGLILLFAGLAMLAIHGRLPGMGDVLIVWGTLGVAVGVGFVLSAAISYWLSKAWGLMEQEARSPR